MTATRDRRKMEQGERRASRREKRGKKKETEAGIRGLRSQSSRTRGENCDRLNLLRPCFTLAVCWWVNEPFARFQESPTDLVHTQARGGEPRVTSEHIVGGAIRRRLVGVVNTYCYCCCCSYPEQLDKSHATSVCLVGGGSEFCHCVDWWLPPGESQRSGFDQRE